MYLSCELLLNHIRIYLKTPLITIKCTCNKIIVILLSTLQDMIQLHPILVKSSITLGQMFSRAPLHINLLLSLQRLQAIYPLLPESHQCSPNTPRQSLVTLSTQWNPPLTSNTISITIF